MSSSNGNGRGGRPRIFTDEIRAIIPLWVNQGLSREVIAERIGTTVAGLSMACSQYRISLRPSTLSEKAWAAIESEARKLCVTPESLITLVMERVGSDNLFKAILDFSEPRHLVKRHD